MNKMTISLVIAITALSFIFGAAVQSKAQDKTYNSVVPFVTGNDRVGFFDKNNGRIYIYDNNVSQCVFVGQITALGQPIQTLETNPVHQ